MGTLLSCRKFLASVLLLAAAASPGALRAQTTGGGLVPVGGTIFTPSFQWVARSKQSELLTKLRLRGVFDSDVAVARGRRLSGVYTLGESDWRYSRQGPRQGWQLDYRLGGRVYAQRFAGLDTTSNSVQLQAQDRITNRLSVSAMQRYANLPSTGLEEPATSLAGPPVGFGEGNVEFLARKKTEWASALVFQYHPDGRTTLSWGGNYSDLRYSPATILRSRTYAPYISFSRRVTARQALGFGYTSQWIEFPGQPVRARVDGFLGTYFHQLSPSLSVSVFGGPGVVHQSFRGPFNSGVFEGTRKSLVGGVAVSRKRGRNEFVVKYSRAFVRGSALFGTTLRESVGGDISRRLGPHLVGYFSGNYTRDSLAGVAATAFKSYRFQPSLRYQLSSRLWLNFSESYTATPSRGRLAGANRNVVALGLEYRLPDKALGR